MNAMLDSTRFKEPDVERIDDITDFYVWDVDDLSRAVETASVFCGERTARPIGQTNVAPWLRGLLQHVRAKHPRKTDFRVEYEHDGKLFLYRGHRDTTVGDPMLALRRHPTIAPTLDDLVLPPLWRELFMRPALLRGGLILLAAVTGQGKSTTTSGIVTSRLRTFGGFCRTIEDPPELPLHGTHGDGLCIQTPVLEEDGEAGFARALRSALRSYPALPSGGTICVVGEVRDGDTAAELLRASVNGHLVLTTVHANDVSSALARLAAMAQTAMGEVMARDLLATGLVYAIHQTLTFDPTATGWRRGKIGGSILTSTGPACAPAVSIRDGRFTNLAQPLDQQANLLRNVRSVDEFITRLDSNAKK